MPRFRLSAVLFSLAVILSIPAPVEFGFTGRDHNFGIQRPLTPAVPQPTNVAVTGEHVGDRTSVGRSTPDPGTIFLLGYGIAGVAFGRRLRRCHPIIAASAARPSAPMFEQPWRAHPPCSPRTPGTHPARSRDLR